MASAASSPLASSVEKTNGAKLSRLLIDGGTTLLRNIFNRYHPPANLVAGLNANYPTLNNLLRKRVLHKPQWNQLFPPGGVTPDSNTFDITLLFLLLTNICGLSPPSSGWHTKPPPSDISLEANLARIKFFRNELYGHVASTCIDAPTFTALWQEISAVLVALGLHQAEIDRLKVERCGEDDYIDVLLEWADSEEDIKSQLRDIHQYQTGVQQTVDKVHQTQLEDHQTLQDSKAKLEEVHQVQTKVQQTVDKVERTQEEDHQTLQDSKAKLEEVHQVQTKTQQKVEEVSESLETLQQQLQQKDLQGEKAKQREDEILKKLAKIDTLTDVRHHADRYVEGTRLSVFAKVENWLDDRSSPNRVMVISGNAGMGKSVISAVMCNRMLEAGRLSGSHFCQHNKARQRNPKVMLQSLACHLSDSLPDYKKALVEKLSRNLGVEINNMEVKDLYEVLFEEPLNSLNDPGLTYLMVIDGLDESEYQGRNELLDVIANYFNKLPLWIRFLVTTRPEINIADSLKCLQPLQLEPNNEENLKDIYLCFKQQLSHALQCEYQEIILQELVQRSEGIMLYAHYLVDFIKKNVSFITPEQLYSALPSGISSVYQSYFERLENDLRKELKVTEDQFLNFLSAIAAAREPLPIGFVSKLLLSGTWSSAGQRKVVKAIACISTLLPVEDNCIHFFHKSVKDWLIEKSSYEQHNFSVDQKECHRSLAKLCADELDDVKRKGVNSAQFSDNTKYALQHGVQHMLELEEDSRAYSLEEVVKKYVLDLELVYAKLCVNVTAASEDILCIQKQEGTKSLFEECQTALSTLLFLLRKYSKSLTELPYVFFQTLLNEGGLELSSEASNLLETKYSEMPYMEYLHKKDLQGPIQTRFECSAEVACFDVSPQLEYMVCECNNATIQLWSIPTGKLIWKRPVMVTKLYYNGAYRSDRFTSLSFYRSVVFHPNEDIVLPGVLSHAYNIGGDRKPLFLSSKCSFSVCSISGDRTKMLTDCPDDAKSIIMWSLINGSEISRFTGNKDILSFAWSHDGRLLAISHSTGSISLVDVMDGFKILAQTVAPAGCGMIKFSTDCRILYCLYFTLNLNHRKLLRVNIKMENHCNFSSDGFSLDYWNEPWEFESRSEAGFLLGDPICPFPYYQFKFNAEFVFVLNKQSVLRGSPSDVFIDMMMYVANDREDIANVSGTRGVFSMNGETVYVFSSAKIVALDTSSGEFRGDKTIGSIPKSLLAVRDGVLFPASSNTLELWNFDLSECIRRWTDLGYINHVFPISEERVACVGNKVDILDTTSGDIVSTIKHFHWQVVACNSKSQLITLRPDNWSGPVLFFSPYLSVSLDFWAGPPLLVGPGNCNSLIQLWDGEIVLWESHIRSNMFSKPQFSPVEQFVVIIAGQVLDGHTIDDKPAIYVLDAASGQTLRILPMLYTTLWNCFDYMFVSDEVCVVSTRNNADVRASGCCLRLFNIKSGDLLSVMEVKKGAYRFAACPRKHLIAIGLTDSNHKFNVIHVKLPQDKDSRKSKRISIKSKE